MLSLGRRLRSTLRPIVPYPSLLCRMAVNFCDYSPDAVTIPHLLPPEQGAGLFGCYEIGLSGVHVKRVAAKSTSRRELDDELSITEHPSGMSEWPRTQVTLAFEHLPH